MKKTAVIAGASGLIGTALLPLLLQSDEYEAVHSLGRRMLDVRHEKLTQHMVDFGRHTAMDAVLASITELGGRGGMIGIDAMGSIHLPFSTSSMVRAGRNSAGIRFVEVW